MQCRLRVMKRGLLVIAAGLAAVVGLAAPAPADAPKVRSTVHIHGLGPDPSYVAWVGDVHSPKRKCERGRTVTAYYYVGGTAQQTDEVVTDRFGDFTADAGLVGDEYYYAIVSRKVVGSGDNKIVCKSDRSPNVTLPEP
jgi:hypothetical protein